MCITDGERSLPALFSSSEVVLLAAAMSVFSVAEISTSKKASPRRVSSFAQVP